MPENDILAALRAIVDQGGPSTPARSLPRPSSAIGKAPPIQRPLPMADELLGRARGFTDLLNETPLGLVADFNDPLSLATVPGVPRPIPKIRQPMPSARRAEELVAKFGGRGEALPMDEASRMQRATDLGYTHDVYHGTPKDFTEFSDAIKSGDLGDGDFGIHVSSDPNAANVMHSPMGHLADQMPTRILDAERGGRTMPLKAQMNKTLQLPDMGIWKNPYAYIERFNRAQGGNMNMREQTSDPEFLGRLADEAKRIQRQQGVSEAQQTAQWQHKLKEMLQEAGYDSIKYLNNVESDGAPSYLLLDPRQLRSRFAAFDPAKANSKNLLASLAAAIGLAPAVSHEQE